MSGREPGEAIGWRARSLVGARFRPQGRDAATGLDCIGLAAAAAGIPPHRVPADYALRGGSLHRLERGLRALGWRRVRRGRTGDLLVCEAGPAQLHLAVRVSGAVVHADACARRVAERPLPVPWRILGEWRYGGER